MDAGHEGMAERAVDLLIRRIEQAEPSARHQDFVGDFSLVVRESTGG